MNKTSAVQIIFWGLCLGACRTVSAAWPLPAELEEPLSDHIIAGKTRKQLSVALAHRIHHGLATLEEVEHCLERGIDVNAENMLLGAVKHLNIPIVKLLLESGANIDIVGDVERKNILMHIPLHNLPFGVHGGPLSVEQSSVMALLELLCEHGANVNACDKQGSTFLMSAVFCSYLVDYLITKNVNLDIQDIHRETALTRAVVGPLGTGLPAITSFIKAGAGLDLQNNRGQTALVQAANLYRLDVVEKLVEGGADPLLKDYSGKAALDYLDERIREGRPVRNLEKESRVWQLLQDAHAAAVKKSEERQIFQTAQKRNILFDAEFKELTSSKSIITWV